VPGVDTPREVIPIEAERAAIVSAVRRLLAVAAAVALVAVLVVGLTQAGGDSQREPEAAPFDLQAAQSELAGAPAPLAALHDQSSELLDGGTDAFEQRIADLEGHPAVINKWASWCRPCRSEFPIFQQVATDHGKEIAFLGVNAGDKRPAAERFLAERPLPYPSYEDPDEEIARALKASKVYPVTVFVDSRGETAFIKTGEYVSAEELEADIDRYLGA
jgi:cytochrome c biogenesis protein CcmG, thiol:disulfide interchange protein DsbE